MKKNLQIFKYVLIDYFLAAFAWAFFYFYRKAYIEFDLLFPIEYYFNDKKFLLGLLFVPILWIFIYALSGNYSNIYRRSRLKEFFQMLTITFFGVLVLFFVLLIDDKVYSYKTYYKSIAALYAIHFLFTYPIRLYISTNIVKKVHNRIIGYNTLLIGSNQNALNLFEEMQGQRVSSGNKFVGFVHIENKNGKGHLLKNYLPHLGELVDLKKIIEEKEIEEVIIAVESWEHEFLKKIIDELEDGRVIVKIIPDVYDILSGSVKMTSIFGAPLMEISDHYMQPWQKFLKRLLDIVVSCICLVVLSPIYFITAILVRFSSKGPIFYSHERIGIYGKPFLMYKFRSMYVDAEKNGPSLSSQNDPRITPFGSFMRKVRLDELPQFYNVLIGEMSLVGPRPERQFFIDQIVKTAPHYKLLHKIKPGITSWGQVKYGYAENVSEMIERLKYDLLYIENMSLMVDLKILIYTVLIVVQGRGK
jgi:exopolysaccharide biosynthesis polyprenyl glycosylphosphotransferase